MTVRDVYEATLIEINKENSQSFTIEEFNYILNKAILAYTNEKYNFYAVNQQVSDDLRVLVRSQVFSINDTVDVEPGNDTVAVFNTTTSYLLSDITGASNATLSTTRDLAVNNVIRFGDSTTSHTINNITGNTVTFTPATTALRGVPILVLNEPIPVPESNTNTARSVDINFTSSDYLHLISCRVLWKNKRPLKDEIAELVFPVKRLTYDMLNAIQNNTYLNPAPNRPYYQILNHMNNSGVINLNIASGDYKAHQNRPKIKIHLGNRNNHMELRSIEFDYIKIPETAVLNDFDIFSVAEDTSQVLELPDYLLNEIVKRCTAYLLEKSNDPRMQTQPVFNQEIPKVPLSLSLGGAAPQQED